MTPDSELLRRYAKEGDEAAFAEVVRRHTDLAYSAALRIVRDAALAQDVTQTVFTKLARMAGALGGYPTPIGWLHTTTRHTAINAVRAETRRRAREHEAFTMQSISSMPDANWEQLRPILDEAVGQLRERDRQAVLLRFFNGLSYHEVGAVIGLTEDSAQKCVDRALEKLRARFARQGVMVSSALLATAMSANSVQAAPAGLAANVAKASTISTSSGVSLGSALLIAFYMSTKIKTFVAVVVIAVILGGLWWFSQSTVTVPEKTAIATEVVQVEAPKLPAVMPKPESAIPVSVTDASINTDPQAELNTAIYDIARLIRAGDKETILKTYNPPDRALNPQALQQEEYALKQMKNIMAKSPQGPQIKQGYQQLNDAKAQHYEDLELQTPTFDAAGDEATYALTVDMIALGPSNQPLRSQELEPVIFIKINGKWYLKAGPY